MEKLPRFAPGKDELDGLLLRLKQLPCPHCGASETLVGHGFLRGYAERSSTVEERGRRVFCSNRGQRGGCGRTVSVLLGDVVRRFSLRTLMLWKFLKALAELGAVEQALRPLDWPLSVRSAYRITVRLRRESFVWRAWLCSRSSVPEVTSSYPLAPLVHHLEQELGAHPLRRYQCITQTSLL